MIYERLAEGSPYKDITVEHLKVTSVLRLTFNLLPVDVGPCVSLCVPSICLSFRLLSFLSHPSFFSQILASDGLRTLCCAVRTIPPQQYEAWSAQFHQASISLDNREAEVRESKTRKRTRSLT